MTRMQQISLLLALIPPTVTFAATVPQTILPDNVITCQPNANCVSKKLNGRNYKVINSPRFTVMVSISKEGPYTRADVSIANNTVMPQNVTPEDFRVEVITPKPKVLLYVSPNDVKDLPSAPTPQSPTSPTPQLGSSLLPRQVATSSTGPGDSQDPNPEQFDAEAKNRAADQAASEHPLEPTSLSPNEVTSGRVYFERVKHEQLVNIVLPIAGLVFEFPYNMK
ncbi:hypothetical protein [Tunturiibacter gelidoferens]|uniref:AMIN domain-containing protein n=2 Tax=Tunturiibacter TaxID=3154218 RepID=A0A7Y9NPY5_9BACT|nr:hypothetical protein [Edaphobacter lichenicola]MBB5341622.1 hypothetical protein [Edaphobacter lichenicola]NYF53404.1 hypothetical protein [Edaphobacter lichenicola]